MRPFEVKVNSTNGNPLLSGDGNGKKLKKKVLFLDPSGYWIKPLLPFFGKNNYQVESTVNWNLAREALDHEEFDLALIDEKAIESIDIQVIHEIKRVKNILLVVLENLMGGKNTASGKRDLLEIDWVIEEPIGRIELLALIEEMVYRHKQRPQEEEGEESAPRDSEKDQALEALLMASSIDNKDFYRIPFDDLKLEKDNPPNFPLFANVFDRQVTYVANANEVFLDNIYRALEKREIYHLYLRKEDYFQYLDRQIKLLPVQLENSKVRLERKLDTLQQIFKLILYPIYNRPLNDQLINKAQVFLKIANDFVFSQQKFLESLGRIALYQSFDFTMGLGMAMMVGQLTRILLTDARPEFLKFELPPGATITMEEAAKRLEVFGLIFPLALKGADPALLAIPRGNLKPADKGVLHHHLEDSIGLFSPFSVLSPMTSLVLPHFFENGLGTGIPKGLTAEKINPLAKLMAFADFYVTSFIQLQELGREKLSEKDLKSGRIFAGTILKAAEQKSFDPYIVKTLQELFLVG